MKKDWIKEAYRSWFARLDEEVPEETWTGIADELDIDEVWDRIAGELDQPRKIQPWWWIRRAAAVFLLLFSALAAYWYLSPPPSPSQDGEKTPLVMQTPPAGQNDSGRETIRARPRAARTPDDRAAGSEEETFSGTEDDARPRSEDEALAGSGGTRAPSVSPNADREPAADNSPIAYNTQQDRLLEEARLNVMAPPALPAGPIPVASTIPAKKGLTQQSPAQQKGQAERVKLPVLPEPGIPGEQLASLSSPGKSTGADIAAASGKAQPFIQLQRLGVISAYNNTWMLNHETFNGLQSGTLSKTTFTYGSSAGLNAGFLVKGKHRIGAELYFNSHSGQGYRQYIEARYQSRSVALDYYKLQLYYQLPVFSGKGDVLAGAYGSYLKRGREEIAGETRRVGGFYRDIDYGLMAGYQFNLPINDRLLLQPAIRVNYGVPNIFKGNQLIPENFLRTHNASAGLYLGISYRLY